MSFMQEIYATASWLASREIQFVDQTKRRLNAYNRALGLGGRTMQIPAEAMEHVRQREKEKVTLFGQKDTSNKAYDQHQVDFWRNHTHELYDLVMHRAPAFVNSSYDDTGLAINFCAA